MFYRNKRKWLYVPLVIASFLVIALWQHPQLKEKSTSLVVESAVASAINEPIQPIPLDIELNEEKVKLGEKLFNDPKLSHDNSVSCVSCHVLSKGGTDQVVRSIGIKGAVGNINAPTVFNSGFNFNQFWDGHAASLENQIDDPIHSSIEMGSSWPEIISKLYKSTEYVSTFKRLYSDGIQEQNIKDAIATFERSLSTPNSRFDKFLRGNKNALTNEEKEGYRLFKENGCVSCHQGVNLGGNMFQEFGVMGDYFADRGNVTKADLGRFNVTKDEQDRYVFKVPSLRNVALTSPYFHDGSASTLEEAIAVMAKYQLGRQLSQKDSDLIIKFLTTLNGEYKGKAL